MNKLSFNWELARTALAVEKAEKAEKKPIAETAFLPAALELIERPVSPTSRLTAGILLGGVAFAFAWLTIGRTEIVASAPGKLVPVDAVQVIQPAETGVVRKIRVHGGQYVKKGQVLVEMDPTVSTAELAQAREAYLTVAFQVARLRAVVDTLDGKPFNFVAPAGSSDPVTYSTQLRLARAELADVEGAVTAQSADSEAARADISAARAEAARLSATLPLLNQQLAANQQLLAKGFASRLKVLDIERQVISQQHERQVAEQTIRRASARAVSASANVHRTRAEMRARLLEQLLTAEGDMRLRKEELVKTEKKASFQFLRAPVDGRVDQLAIHTEGGVAEAVKPVMTVVPDKGGLVAEVKLLNREAGFVSVGQKVSVKLDAYPFSRYGTVAGTVETISPNSVEDEKLGLIYTVRVKLDRLRIDRGDRVAILSPGLSVVADMITGERSFFSYLTSPIAEASVDSLKER